MTKISVLMPAYNYARYVSQAVSSVLDSSFTDFELIVIDDGSTDDTWSILESFDDPRVVALRNDTNLGMGATLNRGLGLASGDLIGVLNSDDRYHTDYLQRIHDVFATAGPELGAVGTYLRPIDADGYGLVDHPAEADINRPLDLDDPAAWIWNNRFSGSALVRRSVFDAVGGFSPDVTSAMDWDLWIRALAAGFRFRVIEEVLFDWRLHGENITNRDATVTLEGYSLISQRHLHPYLTRIGREDLLAVNVAGFLTHEALITADVSFAARILDRVLVPLTSVQQAAAIRCAGEELLRLRAYYLGEAARVDYLQGLIAASEQRTTDTAEALRERDYQLSAALDRLGAAEADRRAAQAEVAAAKNTPLRRAGRKVKRRLGK